ncbi:MAG TPA: aminoglycoside adenylyltransferase domain-containing protein [Candidatus Babeliales bacterium]|nr:aminoglycoside adenylyltransferase domain-containing protein [Candidatus Babeliales bacterium]
MSESTIPYITRYKDINKLLHIFITEIQTIFGKNLTGIYLTGSLSYGDFNPKSSDIDLMVILKNSVSHNEIEQINKVHQKIGKAHKKWGQRIECSYISVDMLKDIYPPKLPRPYFGEGIFYPEAPYGNEWLINKYLLYNYGIALVGPEFKTLTQPIDIVDVKKACINDLFQEWKPRITDQLYLEKSHHQSYAILTMCRILYTINCDAIASKKTAAAWVKITFPHWSKIIQAAEKWHDGLKMNLLDETARFIAFVIEKTQGHFGAIMECS